MKTWILVANASIGYLYQSDNLRNGNMNLLKEFNHPRSREKGTDILTDRAGHFSTDHGARSTYEKSEPKKAEAENFSYELVTALNHGYNNHDFTKLILVAAPHFYGLMNKHLSFDESNVVHVPKDYTKLKAQDLLNTLRNHLSLK